jgi:hypothetical protein
MERKEVEVYSEASNQGIVRMPGRQFPGCVVQGDSLAILCSFARSIHERLAGNPDEELTIDASELLRLLEDRQRHYESVLAQHNIKLPY